YLPRRSWSGWSSPARTASSSRSWAETPSDARFSHVGGKEGETVLCRHSVVEGPAVGGARAHHLIEHEGDAAGGALYLRQAGVEQLARAGDGQLLRHLSSGRHALHDDAELVARAVFQRLHVAHDAVAPEHVVVQLIARLAEALAHLLPRPVDHLVDVGDGVGVADAGDTDVALTELAGAFQLHAELGRRLEHRAGDARG